MTSAMASMQVVFRTDASIQIGNGHVMRCLSLAAGLAEEGAHVQFLCRADDGNLIDLIAQHQFIVHSLPTGGTVKSQDEPGLPNHSDWLGCDWQTDVQHCRDIISDPVDWIIVDHYALDHRWETAIRDKCCCIMCIDDLANRVHDCEVLLDQNLGRTADDYRDFLTKETRMLLGPQYALLRPEFARWRETSLARRQNPELCHILVTMGGVDRNNLTGRALRALKQCQRDTLERITVVLGPHAPWRDQVIALAEEMPVNTTVLSAVDNMAELMTSCDLAIGASGGTTWERCYLGVPSVMSVLADNQKNIAKYMLQANAAYIIEDMRAFETRLLTFLEKRELLDLMRTFSIASAQLFYANGVGETISELGTICGK